MLSLRTLLRHPIQFVIMTLGIALGVAVMVSIDLANASAARAFEISTSVVTGRATHAIIGSTQGLDESIYVRLRTDPRWHGSLESAPLVIAYAVSRKWVRCRSPCSASIRLLKPPFETTWARATNRAWRQLPRC